MIFSVAHILLTAAITSALALIAAFWRLPRSAWLDILAITVLSGVAVLLWRLSANMPQLNDDGLPGFSCGCRTGHPPHATWEYSWINFTEPIAASDAKRGRRRRGWKRLQRRCLV
jgi:hypothetical protein